MSTAQEILDWANGAFGEKTLEYIKNNTAVQYYAGGKSEVMSKYIALINSNPGVKNMTGTEYPDYAIELQKIISRYCIKEDMVVYRKINIDEYFKLVKCSIKRKIYPGFLSTTISKDLYDGSCDSKMFWITLYLIKGIHAIYIPEFTDITKEYELLIKPNFHIKMLGLKEFLVTNY